MGSFYLNALCNLSALNNHHKKFSAFRCFP